MGNYYMHYPFNLGIRMPDLGLHTLAFPSLWFTFQKCHTYGSKLPYFWVVSMGVLGRKPQGYGWGSGGKGMLFFETKKEIT